MVGKGARYIKKGGTGHDGGVTTEKRGSIEALKGEEETKSAYNNRLGGTKRKKSRPPQYTAKEKKLIVR